MPAVTFLTDMGVHPLWVAPGIDAHLALHDLPAHQATALGATRVLVTGPMVAPSFRPGTTGDRAVLRVGFGLPGARPLALVVAGSWGVGDVTRTVGDLLETGLVTPVVVCGTNHALRRRVQALPGALALGWVHDVSGLPVLTYRSLPGHGRINNDALAAAGWAHWARRPTRLTQALFDVLGTRAAAGTPGHLDFYELVPVPLAVAA